MFYQHFALPEAIAVTPGTTYVIELLATNESLAWLSRSGVGDACSVTTYPGGQRIDFGQPEPGDAFLFRTYAAVPAPTPTLSPPPPIITPTLTPTPTHLAPIVDCPGFETEREILSRTVADLWGPSGASQSCSHITCPSGEVKISGHSSCLPNGIAAGFGYSNPFWVQHGGKLPFNVVSILRFDTEADAAAALIERGIHLDDKFNNCPALSIPQGYPPVEGFLYWQVSRWVFSVEEYDDGSSFLKSLGLDKVAIAQRMYEVGAELGLVCPPT
jgi:hypothetical protein